ncbi:MAG TPA: methyltransferase domain-containing protein [Thermoanaerobaculia bacterium]|nr:methyltransferase domain-containing protein [Thermoanaerobaculia bacterium]
MPTKSTTSPRRDTTAPRRDGQAPRRENHGPRRTLGPIADLERHLPANWWSTLFNSLYLKTDGDVVESAENTRAEVDMLVRLARLEPNDRILDLCCGQGRHSLELARRGFRDVTGVDRSRYLIRLARNRARAAGLKVGFHEGDARKLRLRTSGFHCVAILGNSFGYFDRSEDDLAVLRSAVRSLAPLGTLYLDIADGDWLRGHFERRSWEWVDQDHFVCRERSLSADGSRLISREVVVHAERGVIADQFYGERLYSREGLVELVEKAGFAAIEVEGPLEATSERNQDLGMMAHRMVLTARGPRETRRAKPHPRHRDVTVLLGDPRLPDTVKKEGVFNADDLATVDRLKEALAELDGWRFSYVDRHDTLIERLQADRPPFVLNLCDEGFENDAFRELHVPALLEMLRIPYSGAGPACLGLCYNKALVRTVATSLDVPVPQETYFASGDLATTIPSVFPALVKPAFGDSSLGITVRSVVHDALELVERVRELQQELPGCPLLIQEFLAGPEYSVGVVGNPGSGRITVLPVLEVDYSQLDPGLPQILGYESKWDPESPYWTQLSYGEASLPEEAQRSLVDGSLRLFERLECRDYARFDFRTGADGEIKLLEVNPNPGWCWDGKLNLMAGFQGLRYAELLSLILEAAWERIAEGAQRPASAGVAVEAGASV